MSGLIYSCRSSKGVWVKVCIGTLATKPAPLPGPVWHLPLPLAAPHFAPHPVPTNPLSTIPCPLAQWICSKRPLNRWCQQGSNLPTSMFGLCTVTKHFTTFMWQCPLIEHVFFSGRLDYHLICWFQLDLSMTSSIIWQCVPNANNLSINQW